MRSQDLRTLASIALNLGAFILVTSCAFQSAHHRGFSRLAALLAHRAATLVLGGAAGWTRRGRAPASIATALIICMGIVRHATILTCFDRCAFKLAAATSRHPSPGCGRRGDAAGWSPALGAAA